MTARPPDPAEVLARGAGRGIVLEEFGPVFASARLRLSRAGWQAAGLGPFLNLDVPYTSTSSGRMSELAATLVLQARPEGGDLRILELGSGSGVFARLFLDALRRKAPERYAATTYVASDGSASILAAQRQMEVFGAHAPRIRQATVDAAGDWAVEGTFDAILSTYLLDSLDFDLLALRDRQTWRREVRGVLPEGRAAEAAALRAALGDPEGAGLASFVALGPLISHQTRHVPVDRRTLPFADSLPTDTGGETVPFVHCHGALEAIMRGLRRLRPGGVMVFSDYGHLLPYSRFEEPEFQTYGTSVAVGVNFPQIAAACASLPGFRFYAPAAEEGSLITRVVQRDPGPDLSALVDDLYGAIRHRALAAPVEAAREVLRGRMYERARGYYAAALELEPRNWALLQEIALFLLIPNGEHAAALDMADLGLALNPLAADLWRARGEALLALGRLPEAAAALDRAVALAPANVPAHRLRAETALRAGRHADALAAVAAALAEDRGGDEQEALLALQARVLADIARAERDRLVISANPFLARDGLSRG